MVRPVPERARPGVTMIPEKLKAALDEHVSAEIGAAYLYLAMSADFESKAYKGFARWMRVQFQEEMAHATKFVDYMLARGAVDRLEGRQGARHQLRHGARDVREDPRAREGRHGPHPQALPPRRGRERHRDAGLPAVVRDGAGRGGGARHRDRRQDPDGRRPSRLGPLPRQGIRQENGVGRLLPLSYPKGVLGESRRRPLPSLSSPLAPSSSRARAPQARAPRRAVGGGRGVGSWVQLPVEP